MNVGKFGGARSIEYVRNGGKVRNVEGFEKAGEAEEVGAKDFDLC